MSRTIPRAFLRDGGWKPWARRGSRREGRREGLLRWTFFHTEYGIWSGPGAEEFEDLARTLEISSGVTGWYESYLWRVRGGAGWVRGGKK